jgi:cell division protein FtsW
MDTNFNTAQRPATATTYDIQLLFPALFLVGIGIVMVYSASSAVAIKQFGSDYFFLAKQAIFALIGLLVLVVCRHFPYKYYRHLAYPLLLFSVVFLVTVFVSPFGISAGGATRWLRIGPLSFQPSEFARIALVIYLAYSLEKKADQLKEFSVGFVPHIFILVILAGLIIKQPDFGSIVILSMLTGLMMFIGGVRIKHLLLFIITLLPAGIYLLMSSEYRWKRLIGFIDPWQYPAAEGYQIVHSLMAFGTGGITGTGLGKGYQKLFYLPEPHTDFIFSVVGEELGLIGVLAIIGLYAWILICGFRIAKNAADPFGSFLAVGLTVAMGLQIVVNMGVALSLLPTKGLTLPFLSYGGTSLLVNMASVGILMNISAARLKESY